MAKEEDVPITPKLNGDPHETRLQRLEDEVSDLRVQNAEVSTRLEHLSSVVENSTRQISDKIDLVVKPLTDTLHEHIKEDALSRNKLNELSSTVTLLDAKETARAQRWVTWRKTIGTLLLGAGAIGLKELAVAIFHAAQR